MPNLIANILFVVACCLLIAGGFYLSDSAWMAAHERWHRKMEQYVEKTIHEESNAPHSLTENPLK